jgi:hypothetical protein
VGIEDLDKWFRAEIEFIHAIKGFLQSSFKE